MKLFNKAEQIKDSEMGREYGTYGGEDI